MRPDAPLSCPLCGQALAPVPDDPYLHQCPSCGTAALRLEPDDADEYAPPWAGWQEALAEDMRRGERGRGSQNKRRRRGGRKPQPVPWYQRASGY